MVVVPEKKSPGRDGQWELLLSKVVAARCQRRISTNKSWKKHHSSDPVLREQRINVGTDRLIASNMNNAKGTVNTVVYESAVPLNDRPIRVRTITLRRMWLTTEQYRTNNEAKNNMSQGFDNPWKEEFKTLLIRVVKRRMAINLQGQRTFPVSLNGDTCRPRWQRVWNRIRIELARGAEKSAKSKEATRGSVQSTTRSEIKRNGQGNKRACATRYHSYNEHVSFQLPVTAWTPSKHFRGAK